MFDDNEDDTPVTLTVNKAYANKYETWREKEEKQKLIARYGSDVEDDSDEESEDENAEDWTEDVEKEFLRCYSILKKRDPKIYDSNTTFFSTPSSSDNKDDTQKKKKEKKMNLKDAEIQYALAEAKNNGEDNDDDNPVLSNGKRSIIEEQEAIKKSIKKVLSTADEDDMLFTKKVKTEAEKAKEDEAYIEWLKGQKSELPDSSMKTDLKYLHDYWNDPSLSERDRFLRDFILNKMHLRHADDDDEDDETKIPSYDEIVKQDDDSDDEFETAEEFERKYNFRYQEPDAEFLKRYPRTIEDSVRRKDDRRKLKRAEIKQRKELERQQKQEEIKRLKNLKKKEIVDKIKRLKTVAGDEDLRLNIDDFDGDFDPKEYDRRMQELFSDNYYEKGTNEDDVPEVSDEELQVEDWDRVDESAVSKPVQSNNQGEQITKKSKKKSKLRQAIAQSKPLFDPKEKTFEQYFDEYYKLDCEDFVSDMPVRFQYRQVEPNDFGLSIEEILSADDRELNAWCSLKKTSQYRSKDEEIRDQHVFKNKAKNFDKKRKILSSIYEEKDESEGPCRYFN
ncbi:unnamed protein product [Adineta steineri]|uniref:Protein KRI1 homolog n=1 Tax=Adineta steineri TaxID=433720 RepID=A0A814IY75_9BILA|nr:unnamed protein product [Adineta steineri]CAF1063697.1 unnamed protein product [Adineta steineri]